MRLCFATNNVHKIDEVRRLVSNKIELVSLSDIGCTEELAETTGSISGNSRQKAEYIFDNYKWNCFADDSGLEVEALDGAPGVDSAIYAGPQRSFNDNINLLLRNMNGKENRKAQFLTIITLVTSSFSQQFVGSLCGEIILEKKGTEGFGYDPVFVPQGFTKTLAQMSMEEKNKISHRAMAMNKLINFLTSHSL